MRSYTNNHRWLLTFTSADRRPLVTKAYKDRDRPDHSKGSMGPRIICPQLVTAPVKLHSWDLQSRPSFMSLLNLPHWKKFYILMNFCMSLLLRLAHRHRSSSCKTTRGGVSGSQRRLSLCLNISRNYCNCKSNKQGHTWSNVGVSWTCLVNGHPQ
jgi:hypothetical protein